METQQREGFATRLGFLLVSAGCAIGIGNVWKFPYVAGQNGGGVFVLFYLMFLLIMGIPVMAMELAMGRASGMTLVKAYKKLEVEGHKWHIHGWVCMIGCYILMMYYTTVSGWMLNYCFKFLTGQFNNVKSEEVGQVFENLTQSPVEMGIFTILTVVLGFGVLSFGVQGGLEKANKFMMIGLLVLIIVLAGHSFTLSGAGEGLKFLLLPDFEQAKSVGINKVMTAAMNQAFFTLSVGMGSIEIFGSYMSKENGLMGEARRIAVLDTIVAVAAGIIIFPACFSYGVEPAQGPSLIFVTLPNIFINMPFGMVWGTLFFVFMSFASFSTVTAVFENLVASLVDNFNIDRKAAIVFNCIFLIFGSLPCVLGFNKWSGLNILGKGSVLDFEDFIVSNLILPIGSLIFVLFCVGGFGWGFRNFQDEVNTGDGIKLPAWIRPYLRFVLPVLIMVIIIEGLF